jgi:hypothetical protein
MKKYLGIAILAFAGIPAASAQTLVSSLDGITFWTGSGPNRSALVIQFAAPSTPASIVWGYRWGGNTQLSAMMGAIDTADTRLSLDVQSFGFGEFVNAISYDQSGLGGTWANTTRTMPGWDGANWNTLYTSAPSANWSGTSFLVSDAGMSDITVANGGWYGWVHSDGPASFPFAQPAAAVPEPAGAFLLAAAGLVFLAAKNLRARRS